MLLFNSTTVAKANRSLCKRKPNRGVKKIEEISQRLWAHMELKSATKSWKQIVTLSNDPSLFSRDITVLERYRKFTSDVKDRFDSVQTYVLHKIFEAPLSVADKLTIDKSFSHLWSSEAGAPQIVRLVQKDLPYAVEEGIDHLVLWSNVCLSGDAIKEYLDRQLLPQKEYVFFEESTPPQDHTWILPCTCIYKKLIKFGNALI